MNTKLPCEFRPTVCFMQFVCFPAYFLHQLSTIMTADRELVERQWWGGICRIFKRGAWHPFGRGGWEVREIRDEIAAQVVDREWTRTLKATNIPPFSVVNLGLTNTLNENHTELNFFELPFMKFWWEKLCTLSRKPQWSQIKTKAE